MTWRVYLDRDRDWGRTHQLVVFKITNTGRDFFCLGSMGMKSISGDERARGDPDLPLVLPKEEMTELMQSFMDEAWAQGFRPLGQNGERGEIQRLVDHKNDLRDLVMRLTHQMIKELE